MNKSTILAALLGICSTTSCIALPVVPVAVVDSVAVVHKCKKADVIAHCHMVIFAAPKKIKSYSVRTNGKQQIKTVVSYNEKGCPKFKRISVKEASSASKKVAQRSHCVSRTKILSNKSRFKRIKVS